MERDRSGIKIAAVGAFAGVMSGLLGVGGGIVMVPLLVLAAAFSQHQAHATSLAAVIPIAAVGALTYALEGEVHFGYAALFALGALVGAPVGARVMSGMSESRLRTVFGALVIGMGVFLVVG